MKATAARLFQESPISFLTRPWIKNRDGTLFYGISKTGNRRTALTTKQGNKTMYKGTRSSGIGKHTTLGKYMIDWVKVRTFKTPSVMNTDLKPLVSDEVPELAHTFKGYQKGPHDTKLYFDKLRNYIKNGEVQTAATDAKCYVERG
ncbi:hypothetical protein TPHA_0I01170 [Tetrapisispora phaffii CBS 4417]|uniref:54S ribosomal protein L27, mitochondrial n=1 Tax=Tetrapisispora phaffii (strain ATCC 24235 / CBS 4417 / NBRC 1672 / NRRL Y-8282 / UCD 70-5) TaxID=1071381 RepID=G8BXJ5_TETPH|nr:mitochondrial 54S ribosomal protein YmL27 TPHA_0I01170 [Tetrapisispora phaffii CBS 4417]CCE64623.1 hypothetical protein TPHA_0I01170 [Tetrapisispora phaffii CBS 4417]